MGTRGKYRAGLGRYYTGFEKALLQQDLLRDPAPADGHPVLDICLGFTSFELALKPAVEYVSYKETRVDRIVQEVFHNADLFHTMRGEASIDNEAIVDGFPVSFWFGFENPMLAVLFSMKGSRKRRRFNFTKKHKRIREQELRRRQTMEGRILTSSVLVMRNSVSLSSSSSSSDSSSDSDWGEESGMGEGRGAIQHFYYRPGIFDSDSDSESDSDTGSDEPPEAHEVSSSESVFEAPPTERNNHMDDGTPGPFLQRQHG